MSGNQVHFSSQPTIRSAKADADEFLEAVQEGLSLSKRIYFGNDRAVAPPRLIPAMEKSPESLFPTSPMIYAVIPDPRYVDNPDLPSYQPYVYGRCDPPALIPLQMNGISLEVDCYLDTAFVTITGSWRVHCVVASSHCDCRIAIPMGEEGSFLGLEVDLPEKSYSTQFVKNDYEKEPEKLAKAENGIFLKPHIFTLTIPQVDGGSNLSVKIRWSQKLSYNDGQISLNIPFSFPDYVIPAGKNMTKIEKIQLNVYPGPGFDIHSKTLSHPLKELRREGAMVGFLHESQVVAWSNKDVNFTYSVSNQHSGGLLLQSPSPLDADQREMFCFYLFPGTEPSTKVFRKEIVFIVDVSASMSGKPIEHTRNALVAAISKLDSRDSFNVIAFNHETRIFSSSLEFATQQVIDNANQWISRNLIANGDTNISRPLSQAVEILSNRSSKNSIPMIFLITDGSVEDERNICKIMKSCVANQESKISPRIYTFGLGPFCNNYFLKMLANIGKGHHFAACDEESIEVQFEALFSRASSTILANIELDALEIVDEVEVYPHDIPDLSSKSALIISGRYRGTFPKTVKAKGIYTDSSNFSIDVKVEYVKNLPLEQVLAKQLIEQYTAHAWFSESKELEEKAAQISERTCFVSEYTHMIMLEFEKGKKKDTKPSKAKVKQEMKEEDDKKNININYSNCTKIFVIKTLGLGFGNIEATSENTQPGLEMQKLPEAAEKFVKGASKCCYALCDWWCCPCCISACSGMNDQCAIILTQLCGALACLGCLSLCELCCD